MIWGCHGKTTILALVVLGMAALAVPAFAAGDLSYTTQYRDHRVRGTTPAEIWRYMNAHPIMDPDDGAAYANITHDHDVSIQVANRNGKCVVSDLRFRWKFVITLPTAVDARRMDARTRSLWNGFRANLKRHEEYHRTIFLACGRQFVPAAAQITATGCFGMKNKVRRYIDKRYDACMAEQRVFERKDGPRVRADPFIRTATGR